MKKFQVWGAAAVIVIGTALHFLYESTGNMAFALFSPVNESVWEHLKIVFFPFLVYGIFEYFVYGRNVKNFIPVRSLSLICAMLIVVAGHYTYSGIIGRSYMWVDILIFVLSVAGGFLLGNALLKTNAYSSRGAAICSVLLIAVMMLCFFAWTFYPPQIEIFRDPDTNGRGISTKI